MVEVREFDAQPGDDQPAAHAEAAASASASAKEADTVERALAAAAAEAELADYDEVAATAKPPTSPTDVDPDEKSDGKEVEVVATEATEGEKPPRGPRGGKRGGQQVRARREAAQQAQQLRDLEARPKTAPTTRSYPAGSHPAEEDDSQPESRRWQNRRWRGGNWNQQVPWQVQAWQRQPNAAATAAGSIARSVDGCLNAVRDMAWLVGQQHQQHAAERAEDRKMLHDMVSTCIRQSSTMTDQFVRDKYQLREQTGSWRSHTGTNQPEAASSSRPISLQGRRIVEQRQAAAKKAIPLLDRPREPPFKGTAAQEPVPEARKKPRLQTPEAKRGRPDKEKEKKEKKEKRHDSRSRTPKGKKGPAPKAKPPDKNAPHDP